MIALRDQLYRARADAERLEHEQLLVVRAARLQVDPADEEVADVDLHDPAGGAGCSQHSDDTRTGVGDRERAGGGRSLGEGQLVVLAARLARPATASAEVSVVERPHRARLR